jgi:hypothetical protein
VIVIEVEFLIKKDIKECAEIIQKTVPSFLEPFNADDPMHIKINKYYYKIKHNNFIFSIARIGAPTITLKGFFVKIGESETKFVGILDRNIAIRILLSIIGVIMSSISMLYLFLYLTNLEMMLQYSLIENILVLTLSFILMFVPLIYIWYINKFHVIDRENFIKYLQDILS